MINLPTGLRATIYDHTPPDELARDPHERLYPRDKAPASGSVGGNLLKPLFETPKRTFITLLGVTALTGIGLEGQPIARATVTAGYAIESVIDDVQTHFRGTNPSKPVYPQGANSSARNPDGSRRYGTP